MTAAGFAKACASFIVRYPLDLPDLPPEDDLAPLLQQLKQQARTPPSDSETDSEGSEE